MRYCGIFASLEKFAWYRGTVARSNVAAYTHYITRTYSHEFCTSCLRVELHRFRKPILTESVVSSGLKDRRSSRIASPAPLHPYSLRRRCANTASAPAPLQPPQPLDRYSHSAPLHHSIGS